MHKQFLILFAIVVAITAVIPATALARPKGVPAGSVLAVNITHKVINDEDSGNVGYWALLNYNKHVQVWKVPDGTYLVIAHYVGKWTTFAGALSPGNGVLQMMDGHGRFKGGYRATFTATDFTGARGYQGVFNFGGTKEDILLGTYGAGQQGATPTFDWTQYFAGFDNFTYLNWGWTYKYKAQKWLNFSTATTGDIVF
jgi:hypothetical protein